MTAPRNISDERITRLDRIGARISVMSNADLAALEAQITMIEQAPHPDPMPAAPDRRAVHGAIVTDRPDLIAAAGGALVTGDGAVTVIPAGGGTVQAPAPTHPAELAKIGGARR